MRGLVPLALVALAGCSDPEPRRDRDSASAFQESLTAGEERARIADKNGAATTMRTGPEVPAQLPPGFTVYQGAKIVTNTVVEEAGGRRILLVFDSGDPIVDVLGFYRQQADAAGAAITFDLGGGERASLGGVLVRGGSKFAIAVRRLSNATRVEFAAN